MDIGEAEIPVLVLLSEEEASFLAILSKSMRLETREVMRDLLRNKMADNRVDCQKCSRPFRPTRRNVMLCPACFEARRALKCAAP